MKTKTMLGIAVCSYLLLGSSSVLAESRQEELIPGYSLEQIVVTANRYEKNDVDIAASTVVLTKEDLERTGTTNLVTALSNVLGLTYMGYGPEGSSLGSKNSNLIIRGMDKGTLVMINGAPINLNGRYHLEDMPFDGVEKVEIVKGGGAVLYGSEAIGGVINIITNNKLKNRVSVGIGSKDRQQYDLSLQAGKLSFAASQKHWGGDVVTSDLITNTKKMNNYMRDQRRNSLYMNYQFDKHSNLLWQRTESKKAYDYVFGDGYQDKSYYNAVRYDRKYKYFKNFVQYNYNSDSLKGNIYYNSTATTTDNNDYMSSSGSTKGYPQHSFDKDRDYSYGADIMKIWNGRNAKYSLGASFQHENYNPDRYAGVDYTKNSYSIYAQWDQQLDKKNNLTLSGRQTWAKMPEKTFSNFSGQIQYVHKLNENESLYASAGQSFRMPYLREMYTNAKKLTGNTELRPEKGIHYEVGWKKNVNNHSWKVALFGYDIKDNITYTLGRSGGTSYSTNQDAKNFGLETSVKYTNRDGFGYQLGFTFANPKVKTSSDNAPSTVTVKDYWDRQYARNQVTGGVNYTKGKWDANLLGTYMFNRVASPTSSESFSIKPYFLTSIHIKYALDAHQDITFTMENLLGRTDNFGGSTTAYYSTPRCFLIKYSYNF